MEEYPEYDKNQETNQAEHQTRAYYQGAGEKISHYMGHASVLMLPVP
jgi:hypothetical protein